MKHTDKMALNAMTYSFIVIFCISCLPYFSYSQNETVTKTPIQTYPTWEAGVFFGFGFIYGDLVNDIDFSAASSQPAYGMMAVRNLNPNWGIRLNLLHTKLKANDLDSKLAGHRARRFSHETPLTELSVLAQWDLRGKRRYKRVAAFNKTVSPYFFAGIAGGMGKPNVFYDDQQDDPKVLEDKKNTTGFRVAIPFGGGIKLDLSQRSFVGLEFGFRPTFGDLLDGVSASGNPEKNDWYAFGGLTIGYRFASDDADNDGVVDAKDKCPGVPGERQFRGCPDTDGDGVQDNDDDCPLIAGAKTMNGCPDSDLDGVADTEDECPNTKGMRRLQGCPDADWDNVIDKNDACPNTPGLVEFRGCPDTDADGVMDLEDKCPDIAGLIKFNGCPEGTEIEITEEVALEEIPEETPTFGEETTAPDDEPIKVKESVMDEIKKSVVEESETMETIVETPDFQPIKAIEQPIENTENPSNSEVLLPNFSLIKFATSSNELSAVDRNQLDEIAALLPNFPDYNLLILGYTDNVGNDIFNQLLSEKRAKTCFDYLVNKGVNPNRMTTTGFGEMNPIATNDTAEGRAENRRVMVTFEK